MNARILLPLVAFLAPAIAHANTGGIEGTIVDQATNQIVGGGKVNVAVTCGTVRKSDSVDGVGHFSISGLPAGSCILTASGALFVTTTLGVTVADGSISTILVHVTTKAYMEQQRKQQEAQRKAWQKQSRRYQMDMDGGEDRMGGGGMAGGRVGGRGLPGVAQRAPMPAPMEPRPAAPPRVAPKPAKPMTVVTKPVDKTPPPPPPGPRADAPERVAGKKANQLAWVDTGTRKAT